LPVPRSRPVRLARHGAAAPRSAKAAPDVDWFDRPMRWAQLTRVEASAGYVDVTVPTITDHEVVAIDLR